MARHPTACKTGSILKAAELFNTFCADIGSEPKGNFGWAAVAGGKAVEVGETLESLALAVASKLQGGKGVALGFECPLFVPLTDQASDLTRARTGEGSRAWCAGAGSGALATGLGQVVWLLRRIREETGPGLPAFLRWQDFAHRPHGLYLWEAFVTSSAKGLRHTDDATSGALAFERALPSPNEVNAIDAGVVHSLIGAALLRTGWSTDLNLLSEPCVVIRA